MIKLKPPKFNNSKESVCKSCFCLSVVLFVLSLVVQIAVTNKYSIKGGEMMDLEYQKESLSREISALKLEVSEVASLSNVEAHALSLGFSEYSSRIVVVGSSQFAAIR